MKTTPNLSDEVLVIIIIVAITIFCNVCRDSAEGIIVYIIQQHKWSGC